jgi:hypothetical protein
MYVKIDTIKTILIWLYVVTILCSVTTDGFWIYDRISWKLDTVRDYTLQVTSIHILVTTFISSLPLLGSGFQQRTFPFLRFPELSPACYSPIQIPSTLNLSDITSKFRIVAMSITARLQTILDTQVCRLMFVISLRVPTFHALSSNGSFVNAIIPRAKETFRTTSILLLRILQNTYVFEDLLPYIIAGPLHRLS